MGTRQRISELFKRGPFLWVGGGIMAVWLEFLTTIWPIDTGKKKQKQNGPRLKAGENALQITCENFRLKMAKLDPETRILCRSS